MEFGAAALYELTGDEKYFKQSLHYSSEEKVTPWMGKDTAKHYEWYPSIISDIMNWRKTPMQKIKRC